MLRAPWSTHRTTATLRQLFSFASTSDKLLMVVGSLAGVVAGLRAPVLYVILGDILDSINGVDTSQVAHSVAAAPQPHLDLAHSTLNRLLAGITGTDSSDPMHAAETGCLELVVFAGVGMVAAMVSVTCWVAASERQLQRIKVAVAQSMLYQDAAWCDSHKVDELSSMLATTVRNVETGLGRRCAHMFIYATAAVGCLVVAFYQVPLLAAVAFACVPVIVAATVMVNGVTAACGGRVQVHAAKAFNVAFETFSQMRTVAALTSETPAIQQYHKHLDAAEKAGVGNGWFLGLGMMLPTAAFECVFALTFWYAVTLVAGDAEGGCTTAGAGSSCITGGKAMTCFFAVMGVANNASSLAPCITAFQVARVSVLSILHMAVQQPGIDASSAEGAQPKAVGGELGFRGVSFAYPHRPTQLVLGKLSLDIVAGEHVALVGPPGGGKSTVLKLLLRLYDPKAGYVTLDGIDVRTLNVAWYRHQVGYLGQEPTLFVGTIRDNIALGKAGSTDDDVTRAAMTAGVHDFISQLPDGYQTKCGGKGMQLSATQKQHIAVARLVIKNPTVLLLDEPTAGLDADGEATVQAALDAVTSEKYRTTITVPHRITAAEGCDRVCVLSGSTLVQTGTYAQLLAVEGAFKDLVEDATEGGHAHPPHHKCASLPEAHIFDAELLRVSSAPECAAVGDPGSHHKPWRYLSRGRRRASIGRRGSAAKPAKRGAVQHSSPRAPPSGAQEPPSAQLLRAASELPLSSPGGLQRMVAYASTGGDLDGCVAADAAAQAGMLGSGGKRRAWAAVLWLLDGTDGWWIMLGVLGSIMVGIMATGDALVIAHVQEALYLPGGADTIRRNGHNWVLGFLVLAAFGGLGHLLLTMSFAVSGARVTRRVREKTFNAMVRHDIGWFDARTTGGLLATLEYDALAVSQAAGLSFAMKLRLLVTTGTGLALTVASCWQIGVAGLAMVPLVAAPALLHYCLVQRREQARARAELECGSATPGGILAEALHSMPTVQALNLQAVLLGRYTAAVRKGTAQRVRLSAVHGALSGYVHAFVNLAAALVLWLAAKLVFDGTSGATDAFVAIYALHRSLVAATDMDSTSGGQHVGYRAAERTLQLCSDPLNTDPMAATGARPARVRGDVHFSRIKFAYPTRAGALVLGRADIGPAHTDTFDLHVAAGQTVALVGAPGSGKSTCLSLFMRFYDAPQGSLRLDGRDVRELSIQWLRSQVGYVGQEPVLFSGTIMDNIRRGRPEAAAEEVHEAARTANAYRFIMELPQGFDTDMGSSTGLALTVAQRQRITIARVALKQPAMLLIDDPTSAMDGDNERQVQAALDALYQQQRRTTIVAAHQLSTVRHADKIAVLAGGCVAAIGTHDELLAESDSLYAAMLAGRQ